MRPGLLTLLGFVGIVALIAAASAVWLVLEQPVTVADAVSTGDYQPLMATLAQELGNLWRAVARLL